MISFDDYANKNKTKHNLDWPYIPDHPYRILIIGDSRSGKTNGLLNLISNQDNQLISKQKEAFNEIADERIKEITELNEKVNYDDLIYRYRGNTANVKFDQFDNVFSLLDKIRDGKISPTDAKNDQAEFKSDLNEIKKGNKEHKSKEQKNSLYSIEMLYKARNSVIKFFDDYSSTISESKLEAKNINKCFKDYR